MSSKKTEQQNTEENKQKFRRQFKLVRSCLHMLVWRHVWGRGRAPLETEELKSEIAVIKQKLPALRTNTTVPVSFHWVSSKAFFCRPWGEVQIWTNALWISVSWRISLLWSLKMESIPHSLSCRFKPLSFLEL